MCRDRIISLACSAKQVCMYSTLATVGPWEAPDTDPTGVTDYRILIAPKTSIFERTSNLSLIATSSHI
jgi:hypothetical protein